MKYESLSQRIPLDEEMVMRSNEIRASKWTLSLILLLVSAVSLAGTSGSHPGASSDGAFERRSAGVDRASSVVNTRSNAMFGDLQAAIDAADPGDTIDVVADIITGTIDVHTSIDLTSTTGATISLGVNTGTAGDARAWFLVREGVDLDVSDLAFDGNGFEVWQGFRHKGSGSFENCVFTNIVFIDPAPFHDTTGFAIVSFTDPGTEGGVSQVDVADCSFSNFGKVAIFGFNSVGEYEGNTMVGNGPSTGSNNNAVNYGIEAGSDAVLTITNNNISNCLGTDDRPASLAESAAILATTAFGDGNTEITVVGNNIWGNLTGILTDDEDTESSAIGAWFNRIVGNGTGIHAGATDEDVDAINNWWGSNGGPGSDGSDTVNTSGGGTVTTSPNLTLNVDASEISTPDDPIAFGETATLSATLNYNSDGVEVGGTSPNHVPDGTEVSFDVTGFGTVNPASSGTVKGEASTTFSPLAVTTSAAACATSGSVVPSCDFLGEPAIIHTAIATIPTLGEAGLITFILLLAGAAMVMMRRNRLANS